MQTASLSEAELASLIEVGKGAVQRQIPAAHASRLIELKLIYRLLGSFRITKAGALRVRM